MKKRNLLAALISGLILALAMPKPGLYIFAWVGMVPLLLALKKTTVFRGMVYGFITGIVYFGIVLSWITLFGYLPWALLIIALALTFAVFAGISTKLQPSRIGWFGYIAIPALWTSIQWLRSLGTYGFTWGSLAHSQANNLPIAQLASITGTWGIDFLVCLFNLAIAYTISSRFRKKNLIPIASALIITLSIYAIGFYSLQKKATHHPNTKIAIIQGCMKHDVIPGPDYVYQAFNTYQMMSLQAARHKPGFIIWPETVLTTPVTDPGWGSLIGNLAKNTHANCLIGGYDAPSKPTTEGAYNGVHLYNRSGKKLGVYRKVHLVPFGEFVPLRDKLPLLKKYNIRDTDVLPGTAYTLLNSEMGKIGVSICFESIFSNISRTEVKNGAVVLFVVTNDSWFKHTQAAEQHLYMSKLRAIENHRFLVRAASTGISALIDPQGKTIKQQGLFKRGIIYGTIAPIKTLTIYTRFGDHFAYMCMLAVLASFALIYITEQRDSQFECYQENEQPAKE